VARRGLSKALGAGLAQIQPVVDDFAVLGHRILQSFNRSVEDKRPKGESSKSRWRLFPGGCLREGSLLVAVQLAGRSRDRLLVQVPCSEWSEPAQLRVREASRRHFTRIGRTAPQPTSIFLASPPSIDGYAPAMGLRGLADRWRVWRVSRVFEQRLTPAAREADQARWHSFIGGLPREGSRFLRVKWNMPPGWGGGNGYPPRPRSTDDIAAITQVAPELVGETDWSLIDTLREKRGFNPVFWSYLLVPADAAPEWWDREFGWLLNPDGSRHSKERKGSRPTGEPVPEDTHEIEDAEELRQHLLQVHGLEYARQRDAPLGPYHRAAHRNEAQDRAWDKLRPPKT